MPTIILDFLKFNQNIDYSFIIPLIVVYLFTFWLIVSGWVLVDAKKRMKRTWKGIVMALLNLIFGVPFLMLYLLIRPIEGEEDAGGQEQLGGINVPIVNFVGKDGVVMSLELRINSDKVASEKASEMKVDVSFQSEDELKQLQPAPAIVITEVVKGSRMTGLSSRIKGGLGNIKKIFKKGSGPSKQSAFKPVNATTLEGREPVPTAVGSESTTVSSAERKLKKKHKKHR